MSAATFAIKSIYIQNAIMLFSLGVVLCLLIHSLYKKKKRHIVALLIWTFLVLWFFNSPFFGFSVVSVSPKGIHLDYGILSIRDVDLPLQTRWEIKSYLSGIKKMQRLYAIKIGDRISMKVKGRDGYALLQEIGESINSMKAKIVGDK